MPYLPPQNAGTARRVFGCFIRFDTIAQPLIGSRLFERGRFATQGISMPKDYLFTSESVTEGHPDKIADQISDGVLDAIIAQDPYARVAVETLVKTGLAVVAGEVTTNCYVDVPKVVRSTVCKIG